jgi:potassium-transporting ATPase KdpC subunit
MRRQLVPAIIAMVLFTVLLGLVYPLVITGVGQVAFKHKADGSLVSVNGKQVGSTLIGQSFLDAKGRPIRKYFQSRPSAATGAEGKTANGYDPTLSAGSNLGPTNPALIKAVAQRAKSYRKLNGLASSVKVPVDAVTTSGSGLDPDISIANARLQAARVADARGVSKAQVLRLIDAHTDGRALGFLGEKTVNVLDLNLALDALKS